ncbi:MAG TPA: RsmB/NOP family class I SAM-dependent RNA methyltransferase [Opitutaceae bacterium]|nr:RsmB/NOP family class I SAM-dependent RNA methyltransferase [Opitutaceae bacterium]
MAKIVKPSLREAWPSAVGLVARWLDLRERIDVLMERLPAAMAGAERARCQHLVFGVVRHFGRIDAALGRLVAHPPRFVTRAALYVAAFELIETSGQGADAGQPAKVVHHSVERTKEMASLAEARLVNAVVRKLAAILPGQPPPGPIAPAEALAEYFSHPPWLVRRWLASFGAVATRSLLEWNQTPAPLYARWRDRSRPAAEWLQPTEWSGFYTVPSGRWPEIGPLLESGSLYLQDPGTRLAVELLGPRPGESVLDLCAAPGGKSLLIVDAVASGRIVSLDVPASRIDRLKENLSRTGVVDAALVQADLLKGAAAVLREHGLPAEYPAVLIDVPCSNTGVMRHRVDVKWRLQEGDFARHARHQGALFAAAAKLVAPGGRLVYSTCSVDTAENEGVVEAFLDRHRGFALEKSAIALPWVVRHDGAAAFLLHRD